MTMIRRWWKGEERLVSVYWRSLAMLAGMYVLFAVVEAGPETFPLLKAAAMIVTFVVWLCLSVFCMVAVWRCAFNVTHRVWGHLARIQMGLGVITAIGEVLKVLRGVS